MAGPLTGIKILDFTTLLPGPFATMMLGDMGAEILRVESPTRPDLMRFWPPFIDEKKTSAIHSFLNRNKKSIHLNLKHKASTDIVKKLIGEYDVLIEQFRPGVMGRLGLGYESLKNFNSRLIYCSLTGYGQSGPLRDKAGHDINYLALSGIMGYTGTKENGPILPGFQLGDIGSGSKDAVIGLMAAIISRNFSGKGQYIDVSIMDGLFAYHTIAGVKELNGDMPVGYETESSNGGSLYDFYETSDKQYMSVGSLEPQFFKEFCKALGREDIIEGGFEQPGKIEQIKKEVKEIFKSKTRDEWVNIFSDCDACVEPVLSLADALKITHVKERGLVVEVPIPGGGSLKQIAHPIKFSETRQEYPCIGCEPGKDTIEILKGVGCTDNDLKEYKETGLFS